MSVGYWIAAGLGFLLGTSSLVFMGRGRRAARQAQALTPGVEDWEGLGVLSQAHARAAHLYGRASHLGFTATGAWLVALCLGLWQAFRG